MGVRDGLSSYERRIFGWSRYFIGSLDVLTKIIQRIPFKVDRVTCTLDRGGLARHPLRKGGKNSEKFFVPSGG